MTRRATIDERPSSHRVRVAQKGRDGKRGHRRSQRRILVRNSEGSSDARTGVEPSRTIPRLRSERPWHVACGNREETARMRKADARSQVDAAPGVNTLRVEKLLLERDDRCWCVRIWRREDDWPSSEEDKDEGTLSARRRGRTAKRRETCCGQYESAQQTAPFYLHWQ